MGLSRDKWYTQKLMNESAKEAISLSSYAIRCPVCGHNMLAGYEDLLKGHISSYCCKCHEYRIVDMESNEVRGSPEPDPVDLRPRAIRCPICGHKMLIAYEDSVDGHISSYCNKCHEYRIIDFKRFRSGSKS